MRINPIRIVLRVLVAVTLNRCILTKNGNKFVRKKVGKIVGNLEKLDELVPRYGEEKSVMDRYKKLCDADNAEIKTIMTDLALQHYTAGDYKVVRSVQERESIDEDLLLTILQNSPEPEIRLNGIIKTKEYVDFDALEAALFRERLPKSVLLEIDKARTIKPVVTLRISKVKKKGGE